MDGLAQGAGTRNPQLIYIWTMQYRFDCPHFQIQNRDKRFCQKCASGSSLRNGSGFMAIDEKTVRRVAHLARLALPPERLAPMAQEISGILAWIEQLQEVDVEGVAPMTSAVAGAALPLREDIVTEGDNATAILSNAPKAEHGFFVVPKVVE